MTKKDAIEIIKKLIELYPDAKCSLDFETPFQMLVAVCLSAQCTDARVNQITPYLFRKLSNPNDFAKADLNEIEDLIKPCGFYKNKAKNLKMAGQKIISNFNGKVPETMEELITIPGVGRKSANVIMLEAFDNPQGIAIDTHAGRIARRLGFTKNEDPAKVEKDLIRLIPKEYWKDVNHVFMWHGRNCCTARNPKCSQCSIKEKCKYYFKSKDTI